jgi:superfamily II DNA or RNA helicase
MTNYQQFLEQKKKTFIESGFEIEESKLNKNLFDFQRYAIKVALKKGKFALFFDCGLGKTLMQLSWAQAVFYETKKKVLVLAPLAVVEQTKDEAVKFGISLDSFDITNYDQLKNIENINQYSGVVLDESSILKGRDGKLSSLIISSFKNTPYKLACTATPSPNDHMELGQHSEFLGAMSYLEMLAMYFVHDGGETSKWRLRKHAKDPFWNMYALGQWLVINLKH